ncbi:transcription factor HES-7-like [Aplochiton taeniatus]
MESKKSKPSRKGLKKILKPVIEKKRRDRINHRLDELRNILLNNTSDMRLKNPKLEKAEILEMTVEYIKTSGKDSKAIHMRKSSEPMTSVVSSQTTQSDPPHRQTQTPPNLIYGAGFQECVYRLTTFIESVDPSQRESFVHELRNHLDGHIARPQNRASSQSIPVDLQAGSPVAEGQYCFGKLGKNSTMGHYIPTFHYHHPSVSLHALPLLLLSIASAHV